MSEVVKLGYNRISVWNSQGNLMDDKISATKNTHTATATFSPQVYRCFNFCLGIISS
jgi:hypothetical protein